jgi:hypothetical protein
MMLINRLYNIKNRVMSNLLRSVVYMVTVEKQVLPVNNDFSMFMMK